MADAALVGLLQDQTDEAMQLLDEQAQATIGGARDIADRSSAPRVGAA